MTVDALDLIVKILTPLVGSSGQLISDLASGAKSLATAKAELASVLAIASQRLDEADVAFASRDAAEDERISHAPIDQTPTKP